MNQIVLTIIGGVGVMVAALAAFFWFWASMIEVPDNISWGATAAGVVAVCAAITWLASLLGSS
jgi:hypothetical protein